MKNIIPLLILCMLSCFAYAQKVVEKHLNFSSNQSVKLNIQIADSIRIITWNKKEVYAKASININDNKYNDDYNLTFNESGDYVTVDAKFDFEKHRDESGNCCHYKSDIYWDVYIPESAGLFVETIDGNIIIAGKTDEIKAHTISGFIDLAIAPARKADFRLSTISGTVYSNLAINKPVSGRSGNTIKSEYNGGGKEVNLETISGDIFLRKAD